MTLQDIARKVVLDYATEIIDVQCEIIKMQSELVKKMCAEIGQQNAFAEEIKRIEALKRKVGAQ